jgi:hypothetical protein
MWQGLVQDSSIFTIANIENNSAEQCITMIISNPALSVKLAQACYWRVFKQARCCPIAFHDKR